MTTTRKNGEEEIDLDDGPVLTTDRLWPAAMPRENGPPPPPPGRRARGTAPLLEPVTSGLIDVRAMAAAYAAERGDAPEIAPSLAEGTSPLALVDPSPAPELDLEPDPESVEEAPRGPSRLPRRAALVVAIGGALAASAVLAGSLLDSDAPSDRPAATAAVERDAVTAPVRPLEGPPLVIEPALEEPAPTDSAPEVRVIPLPTTVTEIAAPAPATVAAERPSVRRPVRDRVPARAAAVAGPLPTRPSNSEIASAVVAVQKRLKGCGDLHGISGAVPVEIRVAPSGAIASVAVHQGTTSFHSCMASALRRQRLPASQVGTTARFPVLLR